MFGAASARAGLAVARSLLTTLACVGPLVAGLGWLYTLRSLGWLSVGPGVPDSLPLLQLAGYDAQPLGRVLVAWLVAGGLAGVLLIRLPRLPRLAIAGPLGIVLLLVASQASFALARNLRFSDVLWSRSPGAGPWVEGVVFAIGCMVPGRLIGDLRLRRGERRDAGEHDPDRGDVD